MSQTLQNTSLKIGKKPLFDLRAAVGGRRLDVSLLGLLAGNAADFGVGRGDSAGWRKTGLFGGLDLGFCNAALIKGC